jgi:5-methylthioadenosine/S-adenosylhomocysteine deaminase
LSSNQRQILSPTWIAAVDPSCSLLEGYSLVIDQDRISALMPRAEATSSFPDASELVLDQHLLTPGFVNVHGHAAMTLLRGIADDREMMDWLTNWIWPIEGQLVDRQFVYDGTRQAAMEMLRSGTTCAADTYFFPEESSRAFSDMHMRAQVAMPVLQFGNAWARNEEEHIHLGLAFHDSIKNSELLTTAFAPHSPYSVTDSGFEKIRLYSEQLDLPVHLHLHETATEISDAIAETGVRPIARMQKLGMVSAALQAVHMTQLRDEEIELLATHGVQVAHCPESNMKLASGNCQVSKLKKSGINVALGTDGAASNNDLDLLLEARTASLLSKTLTGDATSLSADDTLRMMTLDGARFLGLDEEIGSLEPGKLADITAINLSDPVLQPLYNPVSQMIYAATGRDVSHVWVGGQCILAQGKFVQTDITAVTSATRTWQEKVQQVKP